MWDKTIVETITRRSSVFFIAIFGAVNMMKIMEHTEIFIFFPVWIKNISCHKKPKKKKKSPLTCLPHEIDLISDGQWDKIKFE